MAVLRRTENVEAYYKRDLWGVLTGNYKILLEVGRKSYLSQRRVSVQEFRDMATRSDAEPVAYLTAGERTYWRYAGRWHTDNEGLTQDEVRALLVTRQMRRKDTVNRAMSIVAMQRLPAPSQRGSIPADVKQLVWNRDGGACCSCGSNEELQFDHIIPVSMGGASTEDNLQILCGPCNRRKGASVV